MQGSDVNKDWTYKDKDEDKDLKLVLKESLRTRTRTRINITGARSWKRTITCTNLDTCRCNLIFAGIGENCKSALPQGC